SVAASRYGTALGDIAAQIPAGRRHEARASLAGALQVADGLPGSIGRALTLAAREAFVDGLHVAAAVGAALAAVVVVVVLRYLPRSAHHQGGLHGGIESLEVTSELGVGGVMPVVADGEAGDDEA